MEISINGVSDQAYQVRCSFSSSAEVSVEVSGLQASCENRPQRPYQFPHRHRTAARRRLPAAASPRVRSGVHAPSLQCLLALLDTSPRGLALRVGWAAAPGRESGRGTVGHGRVRGLAGPQAEAGWFHVSIEKIIHTVIMYARVVVKIPVYIRLCRLTLRSFLFSRPRRGCLRSGSVPGMIAPAVFGLHNSAFDNVLDCGRWRRTP